MRKLLVLVTLVGVLGTTGTAVADPNLPNISHHRHFIKKGDVLVEVGPRVCGNPTVQQAFNQFHSNIHIHVAGSPGGVAPGLHNLVGPEIVGIPGGVAGTPPCP